jgi:hypothetical protein
MLFGENNKKQGFFLEDSFQRQNIENLSFLKYSKKTGVLYNFKDNLLDIAFNATKFYLATSYH